MAHRDEPQKMAEMARWLDAVTGELELDPQLIEKHQASLLRLISTVAHGPSRPGAPLTSFLVGYAAASKDQDPEELISLLEKRAENWE